MCGLTQEEALAAESPAQNTGQSLQEIEAGKGGKWAEQRGLEGVLYRTLG